MVNSAGQTGIQRPGRKTSGGGSRGREYIGARPSGPKKMDEGGEGGEERGGWRKWRGSKVGRRENDLIRPKA